MQLLQSPLKKEPKPQSSGRGPHRRDGSAQGKRKRIWSAESLCRSGKSITYGAEKIFSHSSSDCPFHLTRTLLAHSIDDIVACTYGRPNAGKMSLADELQLAVSTKTSRRSFAQIIQMAKLSVPPTFETTYQADYKDPQSFQPTARVMDGQSYEETKETGGAPSGSEDAYDSDGPSFSELDSTLDTQ